MIQSEGLKTLVRMRVGGELISATELHPFWVEGQGAWRRAAELRPGDVLREPGERAAVEAVRVLEPEPERVHNLTVAGLHTYYAGEAPVLVHNAGCTSLDELPLDDSGRAELRSSLDRIDSGGPYPHKQDGTAFANREGRLPAQSDPSYYREFTVDTPGASNRGARRVVVGKGGEYYFSADHYGSFTRIDPTR